MCLVVVVVVVVVGHCCVLPEDLHWAVNNHWTQNFN